jgi:hypothetical protein
VNCGLRRVPVAAAEAEDPSQAPAVKWGTTRALGSVATPSAARDHTPKEFGDLVTELPRRQQSILDLRLYQGLLLLEHRVLAPSWFSPATPSATA